MNLCDRNEIQELLRRHGFRFSKSMGQNFLIESWVPEDIAAAAETALAMPHVRVRGLMTIPPVAMEPHGNLAYFEKMRWLYVDINAKIYDNRMEYLSMGMSGDFADAIRCGSNMIRVGTAIFGARD